MTCICIGQGHNANRSNMHGPESGRAERTLLMEEMRLNHGSSSDATGTSAAVRCAAAGHRAGGVADVEAREPEQAVLAGDVIHHCQPLHTAGMVGSVRTPPRPHIVSCRSDAVCCSPDSLHAMSAA